jgi:hypothetical protein
MSDDETPRKPSEEDLFVMEKILYAEAIKVTIDSRTEAEIKQDGELHILIILRSSYIKLLRTLFRQKPLRLDRLDTTLRLKFDPNTNLIRVNQPRDKRLILPD